MKRGLGAKQIVCMNTPDGSVMHAEMQVGDSRVMLADACDKRPAFPAMLHLYVNDADAMHRQALAAGATPVMEVSDQFYGDRMGAVRDHAGNEWWMATHVEDVPDEEMRRRAEEHMKKRS